MSNASTAIAPEVRLFLAKVRQELADLDPDEVREITDGLEADLSELVAERGPASLGNPVEYAGELRLAAGLPTATSVARKPRLLMRAEGLLERSHGFGMRQIDRLPEDLGAMVTGLRPAWWLLRGAVLAAVVIFPLLADERRSLWVSVVVGAALVSAVASMQIGRIWMRSGRGLLRRVAILAFNLAGLAAVIGLPFTAYKALDVQFWYGYQVASDEAAYGYDEGRWAHEGHAGIYSGGRWVSQIFPYDAAGKPLVGVQLFDQTGEPMSVVTQPECASVGEVAPVYEGPDGTEADCWDSEREVETQSRIYYPWTNGAAQLYNVFPLTSRFQDGSDLSATAFVEQMKPAVGEWPFATVPSISLPGVATSAVAEPAGAKKATKKGASDQAGKP